MTKADREKLQTLAKVLKPIEEIVDGIYTSYPKRPFPVGVILVCLSRARQMMEAAK